MVTQNPINNTLSANVLSGGTLASGVTASSLTSVGTLTALTMGGDVTMGANNITMTGTLGATGARLTKGWFTDLTVTNAIAGSVTGNAGTVSNATFTTALTVNTGTLTLTANSANTSVLTVGAGAVSVSGSNSGDNSSSNLLALNSGGTAANLTASNGGIFYSTASAGAILAGTATASKMLLSGATAAPTWSTSTIPTSAGATANKLLLSDGTNYVLSTPTFPNASATSGKIIKSDGTNWTASTETYAAPGTSGNILTSDGTNWTSAVPVVTAASTNTFTNKTYDTAGTGNSFSINGVAVTANTGTGAVARAASPTFTGTVAAAAVTATSVTAGTLTANGGSSVANSLYADAAGGMIQRPGTGSTDDYRLLNSAATVIVMNMPTGTSKLQHPYAFANTTASAANMTVDASGNLLRSTSSLWYKENIADVSDDDAEDVLKLRPITYTAKGGAGRHYGVIAEEVNHVLPLLVGTIVNEDTNRDIVGKVIPDSVEYDRIAVPLLAKVKRQEKIINDLNTRLTAIEDFIKKGASA